jgi:histidinol dehydrogenase
LTQKPEFSNTPDRSLQRLRADFFEEIVPLPPHNAASRLEPPVGPRYLDRDQPEVPMPVFLNTTDAGFEAAFRTLLGQKREEAEDVDQAVAQIIADVRGRGDRAVIELTARFDRLTLSPETLAFTPTEIDAEIARVSPEDRAALELAADRIRAYHNRQKPQDEAWTDATGAMLGWRWTPVSAAGLYVPGGLASYPSSVLMNAIPAKVAGVERLVIACPTPGGKVNPLVLLAARIAGVDTVYRIGGAQAIAALAYGTETIAPVDKITGPGNAFVAAAKRRVFGRVGIDMIAGPSEILVIADADNDPDWIALDLLSQAEHDESAQGILITDSPAFGQAVAKAVAKRLETLDRRAIAGASWENHGAIIITRDLGEAAVLSNRVAPEHLELCTADPEALSRQITHAGAIFLGAYTPEAIGDYVGGPNHVLPTARSARFSSGLSVLDFMKRTTLAKMTPEALKAIGPAAERLAQSEGLQAHGLSVRVRLDRLND